MAGACLMLVVLCFLAALVRVAGAAKGGNGTCDSPSLGFQCHPTISHFWGQYSPFFSVPSEIDASLPKGCEITFVQVLSRHGARDPTGGKSKLYNATIDRIHRDVQNYGTGFEFIKDYQYRLGADQLTDLGRSQMVNSGISFYERYRRLAQDNTPFFRASGQDRVVESGVKWAAGFHQARLADRIPPNDGFPYPILVIPEEDGVNNTLDHSLCTAFERSTEGDKAQAQFLPTFGESVRDRLNQGLPGANLSMAEAVYLMELCPFETVANPGGKLSKFCGLFGEAEWASYDYLQTLGKYYGYGPGSPLGPTQGVGLVNELVARLTDNPVQDHTSTNSTLDSDPATFPLGRRLYADFSHDNDMMTVYAALGLYNATVPLPKTERRGPEDLAGYAASWTVPFAARMYVEKMKCSGKGAARADGNEEGEEEELVRILVNDRVIPLQNCGADVLGRCALSKFVGSLSFARGGGHWDQCFV